MRTAFASFPSTTVEFTPMSLCNEVRERVTGALRPLVYLGDS